MAWAKQRGVTPPQSCLAEQPAHDSAENGTCASCRPAAKKSNGHQKSLISSVAARQCRGLGPTWIAGAMALPPPSVVELPHNPIYVTLQLPCAQFLLRLAVPPPVPPPRAPVI